MFFGCQNVTRHSNPVLLSHSTSQEFQDELKEGREAEEAAEQKQIEDGEEKKAEEE